MDLLSEQVHWIAGETDFSIKFIFFWFPEKIWLYNSIYKTEQEVSIIFVKIRRQLDYDVKDRKKNMNFFMHIMLTNIPLCITFDLF